MARVINGIYDWTEDWVTLTTTNTQPVSGRHLYIEGKLHRILKISGDSRQAVIVDRVTYREFRIELTELAKSGDLK